MTPLKLVVGAADADALRERLRKLAAKAPVKGPPPRKSKCPAGCVNGWIQEPAAARRCTACAPGVEEILERAGVPEHERHASLEADVRAQNSAPAAALKRWVEGGCTIGGEPRGVYLFGAPGVGKTWLAAAALRHAVERHRWSVLWVTARDLLRELQAVYQAGDGVEAGTEQEILSRLHRPRLLVLNELPRRRDSSGRFAPVSPWVAETIEGVIDHRISARRPTLITGNVTDEDLAEVYSPQLSSRMGPRFFARIEFAGVDLRQETR